LCYRINPDSRPDPSRGLPLHRRDLHHEFRPFERRDALAVHGLQALDRRLIEGIDVDDRAKTVEPSAEVSAPDRITMTS
jgi:hypothetical protein